MSLQVGAPFCARNEHRTSLPEHVPHGNLDPRDRLLHQLLFQHLRLLQHGLQVPRNDESVLLQREGRRQAYCPVIEADNSATGCGDMYKNKHNWKILAVAII